MNQMVRPSIAAMNGYVPGEQPKIADIVKLNTNENPYPPSPEVGRALREADFTHLRLYPDPVGQTLREEIAARHGIDPSQVLVANGSDDVLTIVSRAFIDETHPIAFPLPTYSLYQTLAELQCAPVKSVPLNAEDDFSLPDDFEEKVAGASLLMIARPNAPTGNLYPLDRMEKLCSTFRGMILFDEAYADFALDSCDHFLKKYPNVLVSRTFSKSRSLAGLRFGYVMGPAEIITELMKTKDSYNVSMLTQHLALASFRDRAYLEQTVAKVKASRDALARALKALGFRVIPTQTNFVFAAPPERNGEEFFHYLRSKNIIVRYFKGPLTGAFVRITVGLPEHMERLIREAERFVQA